MAVGVFLALCATKAPTASPRPGPSLAIGVPFDDFAASQDAGAVNVLSET